MIACPSSLEKAMPCKPIRIDAIALWLAAALASCPPAPVGAEAGEARIGFIASELKPPGEVKECLRGDFNGDSLPDLAAACMPEDGWDQTVVFHVFLQRKGAGFGPVPDASVPAPAGSAAACCADVAPGPGDEIAIMGADGVTAITGLSGGPVFKTKIFTARTFFAHAPSGSIMALDFARDLNSDGRADLLVPQQGGYLAAFQGEGGAFKDARAIGAPGESKVVRHTNPIFETDFISLNATLPALVAADFDGDGLKDLVALKKPHLWVFVQERGSGFPLKPTVSMQLPFLERGPARAEADLFESKIVRVEDVNRDGLCDLIYSSTHGRIGIFSSIATSYALFLGRKKAFYPEMPDRIIQIPGVALAPDLVDYDGDGDVDLLLASVRTDLFQGVKTALIEEIGVTYFMFRCEGGLWEPSPAFEEKVSFPTSMIDKGEFAPRALFSGDFNGDRLRDKVEVKDGDRMLFFAGMQEDGEWSFSGKHFAEVKADVSADLDVFDLNLDGVSDVVFYHRDRISLVMSKR